MTTVEGRIVRRGDLGAVTAVVGARVMVWAAVPTSTAVVTPPNRAGCSSPPRQSTVRRRLPRELGEATTDASGTFRIRCGRLVSGESPYLVYFVPGDPELHAGAALNLVGEDHVVVTVTVGGQLPSPPAAGTPSGGVTGASPPQPSTTGPANPNLLMHGRTLPAGHFAAGDPYRELADLMEEQDRVFAAAREHIRRGVEAPMIQPVGRIASDLAVSMADLFRPGNEQIVPLLRELSRQRQLDVDRLLSCSNDEWWDAMSAFQQSERQRRVLLQYLLRHHAEDIRDRWYREVAIAAAFEGGGRLLSRYGPQVARYLAETRAGRAAGEAYDRTLGRAVNSLRQYLGEAGASAGVEGEGVARGARPPPAETPAAQPPRVPPEAPAPRPPTPPVEPRPAPVSVVRPGEAPRGPNPAPGHPQPSGGGEAAPHGPPAVEHPPITTTPVQPLPPEISSLVAELPGAVIRVRPQFPLDAVKRFLRNARARTDARLFVAETRSGRVVLEGIEEAEMRVVRESDGSLVQEQVERVWQDTWERREIPIGADGAVPPAQPGLVVGETRTLADGSRIVEVQERLVREVERVVARQPAASGAAEGDVITRVTGYRTRGGQSMAAADFEQGYRGSGVTIVSDREVLGWQFRGRDGGQVHLPRGRNAVVVRFGEWVQKIPLVMTRWRRPITDAERRLAVEAAETSVRAVEALRDPAMLGPCEVGGQTTRFTSRVPNLPTLEDVIVPLESVRDGILRQQYVEAMRFQTARARAAVRSGQPVAPGEEVVATLTGLRGVASRLGGSDAIDVAARGRIQELIAQAEEIKRAAVYALRRAEREGRVHGVEIDHLNDNFLVVGDPLNPSTWRLRWIDAIMPR